MPYATQRKDFPDREAGERGYAAFKYMREAMLMLNRVNEQYSQYRQPEDPDVGTWEEMLREIMNKTVRSSHHKPADDQKEKLYRQERLRLSMQTLSTRVFQKLKKSLAQNHVDYDDFLTELSRGPWVRSKAWKDKRDSQKSNTYPYDESEQAVESEDDMPLARRHEHPNSVHGTMDNDLPPIVSSDDESQTTKRVVESAGNRVEMRKLSGGMMERERLCDGFAQIRRFADKRIIKAYVRGGMSKIQDKGDFDHAMNGGAQLFVCASTNQGCRDLVSMDGAGMNNIETPGNGQGQGASGMDNGPAGQISPANAFGP